MRFVRSDVLADKKGVHIKLDKHVHYELRALAFKMNLSMQELFQEFATQLVNEEKHAVYLVDNLVMNKIKRSIENLGMKPKREEKSINELDHDSLYGLIEDSRREKTQDEDL